MRVFSGKSVCFGLIWLLVITTLLSRLLQRNSSQGESSTLVARARKFHGREVFPGIGTPFSRTTRYGATFVGLERGRIPVVLIGWVYYTPIFFKPGTECSVVGGRWWMVAGKGLHYRETLSGSFGEGFVRWNEDAKIAAVSIEMEVPDGPGASCVVGTLAGGLNHLPFPPLPPIIAATFEPAG